ncbi:hypothetical protein CBR_g22355 [Chara braunii]|uniref:DUF659 domain-containing protein n=1 Tax=Chara braunii TaxID=69332 RepID=A0A388JUT3_CHABU|nr:hypothetical protein CBR_g22355 [Chara braunii]|eukprot:GBG61558.1 hypothetical protein CBR_g22355 [Chara braunii]
MDGWSDRRQRPHVNIMVSYLASVVFWKSECLVRREKGAAAYHAILSKAIKEIGEKSVVGVIMDNAPVCGTAGRMVEAEFKGVFSVPCTAHSIDLILHDIGKIAWVDAVMKKVVAVTKFFTNHQKREEIEEAVMRRWNTMTSPLHCASLFLDPEYRGTNPQHDNEIMAGFWTWVYSWCEEKDWPKVEVDFNNGIDKKGAFGTLKAFDAARDEQPGRWWRRWCYELRLLQPQAIRLLGQASSTSGCERNWSLFEAIHSRPRNCLGAETLKTLVFNRWNLHLLKNIHQMPREKDGRIEWMETPSEKDVTAVARERSDEWRGKVGTGEDMNAVDNKWEDDDAPLVPRREECGSDEEVPEEEGDQSSEVPRGENVYTIANSNDHESRTCSESVTHRKDAGRPPLPVNPAPKQRRGRPNNAEKAAREKVAQAARESQGNGGEGGGVGAEDDDASSKYSSD